MPAVSTAQQNFFKLVNAYKKGGLKKSEVSKDVVSTAKEMSKSAISDYLKLKKNAPEKVPNNRDMMQDPVYEDITLEDLYKFQALMELYQQDNTDNGMRRRTIRL